MGINFQKVNFRYNLFNPLTLKDVDLNICANGEFIFILGHTGSGKSTLVQHMNALLLPVSGQITVFNQNVVKKIKTVYKLNTKKNKVKYSINSNKIIGKGTKIIYNKTLKNLRKNIGLVFQFPEYQLFESTVLKDVMFGPINFGYSLDEAKSLAVKACHMVGLYDDLLEKSPFALSGGQMRRVAIAGILALNPNIIVLDEPTVGLDPKGKEELMNLLISIQKETNKSIIIITHDMDVVGRFAKRVIVMDKGVIVYDGLKRPLFEDYDKLTTFNLDLPNSADLALKLKNRGLISFTHLPLSKEELIKVILGGDILE